ncbi:hypothetical protein [Deinococcus aquaedulcis]|uniref:hypothetical protein n=1 Tax=Deinococcus aquaedulcis TaxID=2840455 RepID=UPI001C82CDEA|nr:hypothetical protein [Deinococcus aquaedulcis]
MTDPLTPADLHLLHADLPPVLPLLTTEDLDPDDLARHEWAEEVPLSPLRLVPLAWTGPGQDHRP